VIHLAENTDDWRHLANTGVARNGGEFLELLLNCSLLKMDDPHEVSYFGKCRDDLCKHLLSRESTCGPPSFEADFLPSHS